MPKYIRYSGAVDTPGIGLIKIVNPENEDVDRS
jgi:hypothetical protein